MATPSSDLPQDQAVGFPCPNCGAQLVRLSGSPILGESASGGLVVAVDGRNVDRLRCQTCGWSKVECPSCGNPLEFWAGRYTCSKCHWMGYGDSYTDDSDGTPQSGAVRAQPPPAKCNRCGAVIQPGDLVIRHETRPDLMACAQCAAAGGFAHMLQRYE